MSKRIYLDYASLTPIDKRVLREAEKYSSKEFANPSSIYTEGVAAKNTMENSRLKIAGLIHAHPDEIFFTSGGTEANNLAIEGTLRVAKQNGINKPHFIISNIEHSSIIETAKMLEASGVEVTRLPVNTDGLISVEAIKKAIRPNTFLVSVMTVNNEIGTVEPIRDIAKVIRWARTNITKTQYPLFHTDACQAAMYTELNVEQLGVDLLTLDGSKMYGPRGIGALYIRRDTPIEQIVYGGGQEREMRSGTENVPGIAGLAKAFELASAERTKETRKIGQLREMFLKGLRDIRSSITVNPFEKEKFTHETHNQLLPQLSAQSPHILNVSIPEIDNEYFLLQLDAAGVAISTKSSCLRDEDESYVLEAIGAPSKSSVRFSFGRFTKKGDITRVLRIIRRILAK